MSFDTSLVEEYWHLLCHRSELSRSGSFVRFETVIGDIVVLNDGANIVAFDNLCPHRGARIYAEPEGRRPATCAYHGWTYRSGRTFVASTERFAKCRPEDLLPRLYQTEWFGDFLFMAIRPRQPLEVQIAGLQDRLQTISSNISNRRDFNNYTYECYWPLAVENALEPYHIDLVHSQTLALLRLKDGEDLCIGQNSIWRAPLGDPSTDKKLRSLSRMFDVSGGYPGYEFIYMFPFTMISSTYGYSYSLQNFFPDKNSMTSFYSRLYTSRPSSERAASILETFFSSTVAVNRQVFEEDHAVCKLLPKDSWSMQPLRLAADSEGKIQHFRFACRMHAETN